MEENTLNQNSLIFYYLPEKFAFDKRKSHLSNLIIPNQLTKNNAFIELEKIQYKPKELEKDVDYMVKKLGISHLEWEDIMNLSLKKYEDYESKKDTLFYKLSYLIRDILR